MHSNNRQAAGVTFSLIGSASFAVMYFYVTLLKGMDADQIYGWRILFTVPIIASVVVASGQWHEVQTIIQRVLKRPLFLGALILSSALLTVQLWMFMWAPLHGYGLDVSLGFFLLPLGLVLAGRYVFNEPLSKYQKIACFFAGVGVLNELVFAPRVSWPAFVVVIGYTIYFILRKKIRIANFGGMWLDMCLSVPLALWFVGGQATASISTMSLTTWLLVGGLGIVSASGLGFMFAASHKLPLGLYGLLSYVEPVLLVGVALLLGERIAPGQWLTYIGIGLAICVLMYEGLLAVQASRKQSGRLSTARS